MFGCAGKWSHSVGTLRVRTHIGKDITCVRKDVRVIEYYDLPSARRRSERN